MASTIDVDAVAPEAAGAPSTAGAAGLAPPMPPAPCGVSEESRDLVAALVGERSLYADDDELKRMAGELLASGRSMEAVAAMLGIRGSTLWYWMSDPVLRRAKRMGVEYTRARIAEDMIDAAREATQEVRRMLVDPTVDPAVKLDAFRELADRTGFGAPEKGRGVGVNVGFAARLAQVAGRGDGGEEVVEEEDDDAEAEAEEFGE